MARRKRKSSGTSRKGSRIQNMPEMKKDMGEGMEEMEDMNEGESVYHDIDKDRMEEEKDSY